MNHDHNPIEALKQVCSEACHERHACTHGYKELMQSDTAESIATVWRRYWRELISEQYADIICEEMPYHYNEIRDGFNRAGVYFNECPEGSMQRAFVLVGNSESPVHIFGYSEAHVLGNVTVIAHNHSRVYCSSDNGRMELLDNANGYANKGYAIARNHSNLYASTNCECYNASNVQLSNGTLEDHGHFTINAYNDAVVNSFTALKINLYDNAKLNI